MWLCTYRRTTLVINVLNWLHHRLARLDAIYLSALSSEIYAQQFPFYTRARIHMRFSFDLYEYCSVNIIRFENKWASVIELNTRSCFLSLSLSSLSISVLYYMHAFSRQLCNCALYSHSKFLNSYCCFRNWGSILHPYMSMKFFIKRHINQEAAPKSAPSEKIHTKHPIYTFTAEKFLGERWYSYIGNAAL